MTGRRLVIATLRVTVGCGRCIRAGLLLSRPGWVTTPSLAGCWPILSTTSKRTPRRPPRWRRWALRPQVQVANQANFRVSLSSGFTQSPPAAALFKVMGTARPQCKSPFTEAQPHFRKRTASEAMPVARRQLPSLGCCCIVASPSPHYQAPWAKKTASLSEAAAAHASCTCAHGWCYTTSDYLESLTVPRRRRSLRLAVHQHPDRTIRPASLRLRRRLNPFQLSCQLD